LTVELKGSTAQQSKKKIGSEEKIEMAESVGPEDIDKKIFVNEIDDKKNHFAKLKFLTFMSTEKPYRSETENTIEIERRSSETSLVENQIVATTDDQQIFDDEVNESMEEVINHAEDTTSEEKGRKKKKIVECNTLEKPLSVQNEEGGVDREKPYRSETENPVERKRRSSEISSVENRTINESMEEVINHTEYTTSEEQKIVEYNTFEKPLYVQNEEGGVDRESISQKVQRNNSRCATQELVDNETDLVEMSGIEAILGAVEEIEDKRKEREVVVDALLVTEIMSSVVHYFAPTVDEEEKQILIDLVIESVVNCDLNYGEKAAIEWGDGFKWKEEQIEADMKLFEQSGMNIGLMAANRLKGLKKNRLNPQRVDSLREDNPERQKLLGLCEGMVVPKPEGFIPNGATSTKGLHKVYKRVHTAVDRMLGDLHNQQLGFILREPVARELIMHHRMLSKWAPKKGKKCGRNIADMSYGEGTSLNGKWAKNEAADMYGPIEHPTIEDVSCMILDFWDEIVGKVEGVGWDELVMWKMDLKGAYTLIDIRPEEVAMFAQELVDGLMYFHLCGVFGWSCTPAAFQVVTRAIVWEMKHKLKGKGIMYVDDILGICLRSQLQHDMDCTRRIVTDLMGPGSLAIEKEEHGTRLEIIGWLIDLDTCRLSIARKNLLKAFYGFFTLKLEEKTRLDELERIASYSERYSLVCKVMKPFQACFNRMIAAHWNGHDRFYWTEEAKLAIRMWRAALYLVIADETHYTKNLWSFREKPVRYIIETDGSLSEVGFLIFEQETLGEVCLGGGAADLTQFGFGTNSGYQNTAEFIGAVIGIIALIKLGVRAEGVRLRGDSKTALKWGREEKVKGAEAINAAIVMATICVKFGIEVNDSEFISGEDNWKADDLSRSIQKGRSVKDIMEDIGFGDKPVININDDPAANRLTEACRPGVGIESETEFIALWKEIREASEELGKENS
jgi:hypothetical protein